MMAAPVPFIDFSTQYAALREELRQAVEQVFESQQFILKDRGAELEKSIALALGTKHGIGCASGSDALYLVLSALGVGAGDEVITTPFTFFATAGSIWRTGAKPVFVDIDPRTFQINPAQIEKAISRRTKAIMPVHLYGLCADMGAISKIADRHHLFVIEDGAQSYGAKIGADHAGSMSAAGCLSFFPTKNLGGAGDGGMVVTSNPELADRIRLLRVHGSRKKYHHEIVGINSRLDELQAAVLLVKLRYIDRWNQSRVSLAQIYDRGLKGLPLETPFVPAGYRHIYHLYTIRSKKRDNLNAFLASQKGIGCGVYYPTPLHLQPCFKELGYRAGDFPEAEKACSEVLSLPIFPEMSEEAAHGVAGAIREFYAA